MEICPGCDKKVDPALSKDWKFPEFEMKCEHCGRTLIVEMEVVDVWYDISVKEETPAQT